MNGFPWAVRTRDQEMVLGNICIIPLPSEAWGSLKKKGQTDSESQRWWMTKNQYLLAIAWQLHNGRDSMHKAHTGSIQTKAQHGGGGVH